MYVFVFSLSVFNTFVTREISPNNGYGLIAILNVMILERNSNKYSPKDGYNRSLCWATHSTILRYSSSIQLVYSSALVLFCKICKKVREKKPRGYRRTIFRYMWRDSTFLIPHLLPLFMHNGIAI